MDLISSFVKNMPNKFFNSLIPIITSKDLSMYVLFCVIVIVALDHEHLVPK